jgi:hypothetical protein
MDEEVARVWRADRRRRYGRLAVAAIVAALLTLGGVATSVAVMRENPPPAGPEPVVTAP